MPDLIANARQHLAAGLDAQRRDNVLARFDQHGPRLLQALTSLYPEPSDAPQAQPSDTLVRVLDGITQTINERRPDLYALDQSRPGDWLDRADLIGYSAYVQRFAGTLNGVRQQVPYLQDLGIRYLHLLPFLKSRQGDNDGGFAVSDYDRVEPELGSVADLERLSASLREAGISLAADFVLNHCADDHAWARAARGGDPHKRGFFHVYSGRAEVDALEAHLPQVFPQSAPGNFSFVPELDAWVWTTFNRYQWDLNWANPKVFQHMLMALLRLANHGIEIFRLDSAAYVWKQAGTDCRNLPKTHVVLQALRAVVDIAAPAVALKAEVIEPMANIPPYFGVDAMAGHECQIAYHSSLMAAGWAALATQRADILGDVIARTPTPPCGCVWLNYVRCHDDIGWWVLAEEAAASDAHSGFDLAWVSRFFAGNVAHSYAEGEAFQSSGASGFHGSNGMAAALLGLHRAIAADDDAEIDLALRRHWLLHAIALSATGIPLLYMGDEFGLGNSSDYRQHPDSGDDGRWLHRPAMDWNLSQRQPFSRLRAGMKQLITARRRCESLRPTTPMTCLHADAPSVFGIQRGSHFLGLYNLGNQDSAVDLTKLTPAACAANGWRDLLRAAPCPARFTLEAYGLRWLELA